jgi:hypothetical protein
MAMYIGSKEFEAAARKAAQDSADGRRTFLNKAAQRKRELNKQKAARK